LIYSVFWKEKDSQRWDSLPWVTSI
jgi:hypothetical protein